MTDTLSPEIYLAADVARIVSGVGARSWDCLADHGGFFAMLIQALAPFLFSSPVTSEVAPDRRT
jgi:hypothetical protein